MTPRLDAELVRRGLARSRGLAVEAIAGGRVTVDGRPVGKPSHPVTEASVLAVSGDDGYVSRAAGKLVAALDGFAVAVAGRFALDLGASTGGFTQVLLERGAVEVIALDVGHGQLHSSIRDDPRVRVVEGVNARELDAESLAAVSGTDVRPDLVVADLSFISLRMVLPAVVATTGSAIDAIVLVKPQFEVGRAGVRSGIVRDRARRQDAVREVVWAAWDAGLATRGILPSPVVGASGNREYLLHLGPPDHADPPEWERAIAALP